jgi:hypothetical protein
MREWEAFARRHGSLTRPLLAVVAAALAARAVQVRGGPVRLGSLALNRLRYGKRRPRPPEGCRLYARGRHRMEAHLSRRADGRHAVLALPVDGSARSNVYTVGASDPWHDFERQAGLVGAAWGPCLSASAGL